jgi:hypothetical protein
MIFRQGILPVSADGAGSESGSAQLTCDITHIVQALVVNFVSPPVLIARFSKRDYPASQGRSARVFMFFDKDEPVLAFSESSRLIARPDLAGLGDVEDEKPVWVKGPMYTAKEALQRLEAGARIKHVVHAFSDRCHRVATRYPGIKQRADPKLGARRPLARYVDHRTGYIYSKDLVVRA